MTTLHIVDHLTGRCASGIDYRAISDAVRGWREPYGIDSMDLRHVEITETAA